MVRQPYSLVLFTICLGAASASADEIALRAALATITADELREHVATLADDTFEGRGVGTRGGRAAAQYVVSRLRSYPLVPAGDDGYFQACDAGGRNILAIWPGSDPALRNEYIVVGAHYDHVGDGRKGHAYGPIGQVYNGADDNASGVAVLIEVIEALAEAHVGTRRSILFAFWDGEEMGMYGSKQWHKQPTVPSDAVRMSINIDMVGRLREGRLQVLGTRTGYNMRRLFAGQVDDDTWLDFSWELTPNSDHWPFIEHEIPTAMLHTGLHDDYHRPSDDAEKTNPEGMRSVARYLLATTVEAADADRLPEFRRAGRSETPAMQRREVAVARRSQPFSSGPGRPRPRLGLAWRTDAAEPASVWVTHVAAESPAAAAGLAVDDRIYAVNGQTFADAREFRELIFALLDSGDVDFTLLVESRGHVRTVTVHYHPTALAANR